MSTPQEGPATPAAEATEQPAPESAPDEPVRPAEAVKSFADRARARSGTAELLVFRVGGELFASALGTVEEAVELPELSPLPEMPASMLGVVTLRGRMLPAYSPARPLGVTLARADAAALVFRAGERRVALAVDDVDDVMTLDLAELRSPPATGAERETASVVLGVARRGRDLVAVLDADALVTACLTDQALETA